jgi:hypothetical protein
MYLTLKVLGSNPYFHTFFDQLSPPDGVEVAGPCGGGAGVVGPRGRDVGQGWGRPPC